jgi:hypothetical protein
VSIVNYGQVLGSSSYPEGAGVVLLQSGHLTNLSGGYISGYNGIQGSGSNGRVTMVNAGSIVALGPVGTGIFLTSSGSRGNTVTNQSGGVISGYVGIDGSGAGLTVVNDGIISGDPSYGTGIFLPSAGVITNQTDGVISGGVGIYGGNGTTIVNDGDVAGGTTAGGGIDLSGAGYVTNQSGGLISGYTGVGGTGGATVVNYGSIGGNYSYAEGTGVALNGTGGVTNKSGGTISGYNGVYASGSGVTVVNAGLISGASDLGIGVELESGATATNQSGGTISGYIGVSVSDGPVVLVNAGVIIGTTDAVTFTAGYTDLLVVDPGASFSGLVNGGNLVGGPAVTTMELAAGASIGTLTGLGSQYINFGQITVDAGAQWALAGSNTVAAGVTITDFGTLTGSGDLLNDGLIVTDPSSIVLDGSLQGSGTVDIGTGSDVTINDGAALTQTIGFTDNTGTLTLGDTTDFAGTIDAFVPGDTI